MIQIKQLRYDHIRDLIVNSRTEENNTFLDQTGKHIDGTIAIIGRLDDVWSNTFEVRDHVFFSPYRSSSSLPKCRKKRQIGLCMHGLENYAAL
jgi:hypothetical protein